MKLLHRAWIRSAQPLGCHDRWPALKVQECGTAVVNVSIPAIRGIVTVEGTDFCDIDWSKYKCDVVCSVYEDDDRILYSAYTKNFVKV